MDYAKNANKSILSKKEVNKMPRGDRTGPMGFGPMTGRGMGYCAGNPGPGFMVPGPGLGFGRGFGMGRGMGGGMGRGMGLGRGGGRRQAGFGRFLGYPYPPMMPHMYPYGMPYGYPFPQGYDYPHEMGYESGYPAPNVPQSPKQKK